VLALGGIYRRVREGGRKGSERFIIPEHRCVEALVQAFYVAYTV
jgi:hypothetical protein